MCKVMFVVCEVEAILLHIKDLFMMGVRLVPDICSTVHVLYHSGFLVTHMSMTHACPD